MLEAGSLRCSVAHNGEIFTHVTSRAQLGAGEETITNYWPVQLNTGITGFFILPLFITFVDIDLLSRRGVVITLRFFLTTNLLVVNYRVVDTVKPSLDETHPLYAGLPWLSHWCTCLVNQKQWYSTFRNSDRVCIGFVIRLGLKYK